MIRQISTLETENKVLTHKTKGLESQNEHLLSTQRKLEIQANKHILQLKRILEPYKDKEKNESNSPLISENLTFDELAQMIQEKLKKFEEMAKVDMNARILEKFDNLREYYRVL
jgi:hypothetical protein